MTAENGGRMQINKATWEDFFEREYGWTWAEIVLNDATNLQAARIIYDRAGGSWGPWACRP